ncbi:phosphate transport system permease protein PstA [Capsulimonas corticalis]|uniref:Phosphate transport system permease protein PstA n=1 Tax=Capsulimonas corticalis TaxID=2219043 RepID=A0A402CXR2_9BACT|nr:phosphate ABC transporter permease PstA [Capsulimonas corticalis]BDI32200.1 phosphate transport system permease protein PstA [Capsulimonas corticalis]
MVNNSTAVKPHRSNVTQRKIANRIMLTLCMLASLAAVTVLGLVLFFLVSKGFSSINLNFFTKLPNHVDEKAGGMSQSIYGTLVLLGLASLIGLPLGILGGIYQLEAKGKFAMIVRFFTDVLNGIPSIVIGIFVYAIWVYPEAQRHPGTGYSAYAGGFALGIMMIPTIMRTTEEILRLVPFSMREASLGLGATRWRTMWSVVLPTARGGVITGIMLALARIAGETAPLLFTVLGNEFFVTHKVFGIKVPTLTAPIDALPLRIYNYATAVDPDQQRMAWAGAVVLITLILVLSIAARTATRGKVLEEK